MNLPLMLIGPVVSIAVVAASAPAQSTGGYPAGAAVGGMQERILADPELTQRVGRLGQRPDVARLLSDPAVAEALQAGDFNSLLTNPEIRRLADDPELKALSRDLAVQP